ncbi:hypothetical protein D9619_002396 [Psilocybe cf. subviscida]|uniref:F-box domain-containing protein n=1 Tax=Psilocybe cf. subviscida TaxID=2480587 RepID=A0A8H5AVV8_9AGAR|nr:hypothetical protein D9619_002396 [Psilocybe cf. subviscida]
MAREMALRMLRPPVQRHQLPAAELIRISSHSMLKIADATESLLKMRAERHRLLSEVNLAHDAIIHRFPLEIFAKIIQHSLPGIEEYSADCTHDHPDEVDSNIKEKLQYTMKVPHILAEVSRNWRDVSLRIPRLWSVVPVCIPANRSPRAMCSSLSIVLSRTGAVPLSIIFYAGDTREKYWDRYRQIIKRIMEMINLQSPRLVLFTAFGSYSWLQHLDFDTLGAPNLKHVGLLSESHDFDRRDDYHLDGFYHVQPLRLGRRTELATLCLQQWTISRLDIDCSRLTQIDVASLSVGACLDILQVAPMLEIYSISNCFMDRQKTVADRAICHQSLQVLNFLRPAMYDADILRAFTVPSLLSFSIHDGLNRVDDLEEFLGLLRRSAPPLQVLALELQLIVRTIDESEDNPTSPLHILMRDIVRTAGTSLRSLSLKLENIYGNPDILQPPQTVDVIFGTNAPPSLHSVTAYAFRYSWSTTLLLLVRRLASLASAKRLPDIKMRVLRNLFSDPGAPLTVDELLSSSSFNQSVVFPKGIHLGIIGTLEIREMLQLINEYSLSISVYTEETRFGDALTRLANVDVFPAIKSRLRDV